MMSLTNNCGAVGGWCWLRLTGGSVASGEQSVSRRWRHPAWVSLVLVAQVIENQLANVLRHRQSVLGSAYAEFLFLFFGQIDAQLFGLVRHGHSFGTEGQIIYYGKDFMIGVTKYIRYGVLNDA